MIKFAYGLTLSEMLGQVPEARPLYEAVVCFINIKENNVIVFRCKKFVLK